jgi:hypothetical protein
MITLKKIAALHIEFASGGNQSKDSNLSYQDVIQRIRLYLNAYIKPLQIEKWNEDDRTPPANFLVNYEVNISNDTLGAYCDIPEYYLSMAHNKGVWRVIHRIPSSTQPGTYTDTEVTPTSNASINRNTRAGRYPTHRKYVLEGMRIRFQNIYAEPGATNKAILQLFVGAPDSIGDSVSLPIAPEIVDQILTRLKQDISPIPVDKLNNNNPNIK